MAHPSDSRSVPNFLRQPVSKYYICAKVNMRLVKPRTRIVSFRLSDAEYESLRTLCLAQGANSLSEYARTMTCGILQEVAQPQARKFEADLQTLQKIVYDLRDE